MAAKLKTILIIEDDPTISSCPVIVMAASANVEQQSPEKISCKNILIVEDDEEALAYMLKHATPMIGGCLRWTASRFCAGGA